MERSSDGQPVIMFKFRPFVEVVQYKYMGGAKGVLKRREIYQMLADYFDGEPSANGARRMFTCQ